MYCNWTKCESSAILLLHTVDALHLSAFKKPLIALLWKVSRILQVSWPSGQEKCAVGRTEFISSLLMSSFQSPILNRLFWKQTQVNSVIVSLFVPYCYKSDLENRESDWNPITNLIGRQASQVPQLTRGAGNLTRDRQACPVQSFGLISTRITDS